MADLKRFKQLPSCIFADSLNSIDGLEKQGHTVNGNPTIVNSQYGHVIKFDGTGDYISLNKNIKFVAGDAWSISFFARCDAVNEDGMVIGDSTASTGYFWFWTGNYAKFSNTAGVNIYFNELTTFDTLAYYALISDGTDVSLYKNGAIVGSPQTIATSFEINSIGRAYANYDFNGIIGDMLIFDRTLTPTEIFNIHHNKAFDYTKDELAYWDMSNVDVIDTNWRENSNNGTATNMTDAANIVNGHSGGKALSFNGSDEKIIIPHSTSLDVIGSTDFSYNLWIKTPAGLPLSSVFDTYGLMIKSVGNIQMELSLRGSSSYRGIMFRLWDDITFLITGCDSDQSSLITDGNWHMLTATADLSGNSTIYIDSVKVGGKDISGITTVNNSGDLFIGSSGTAVWFNGSIDDISIYHNKALTTLEVEDLYARSR